MTNDKLRAEDQLFLRQGTTYTKIPVETIHYIQADGNYAYVQTADQRFAVKRSLASIEEKFAAPQFARVSRGIIVNFDHVTQLSFAEGLIVVGGVDIKMGKAYYQDVKNRISRL